MEIPNLSPVIFHFRKIDKLKYTQGYFIKPTSKQRMLINECFNREGESYFELTCEIRFIKIRILEKSVLNWINYSSRNAFFFFFFFLEVMSFKYWV